MPGRLTRLVGYALSPLLAISGARADPGTVFFPSADGRTEIVGYLFAPKTAGPHPAIVLLHGRGGPYSSNANADCSMVSRSASSACNASTLSKRHMIWGTYWADHGYLALLPDSFGPRGKAHGFGRDTHDDPDRDDVNEKTVRPLDAEGALAYLRTRADVVANSIFLQGWSNGGSTALNVMARQGLQTSGYRAALAFYPGCGPKALLGPQVSSAAPIAMFLASDDEEVSPKFCLQVAERSREAGSKIDVTLYQGATHDFDDPGRERQSVSANRDAFEDVLKKAIAVIEGMKN
jgi:dienelactone hydrolase